MQCGNKDTLQQSPEELGTEAYLSLLPHHIYLQIPYQRPPYGSLTYFNTELTSKTFPIDAWVMTAAYVSMPAIQTGMYMDRLDNKQSIALCLVDLAKGFETSNKDKLSAREIDEFMQNCVNLALQTAPNLITARLLQVELDKRAFERTKSKLIYKQLEDNVTKLFADGYLELPELMYSEKPRTVGLDSTYTPFYEENQREGNPAGYGKKVLTLSNGRYDEFLRAKKIETVGSIRFDTERKRIVGFGENKRQVEVVSRFLSVDPLAKQYPWFSPYQFAGNTPIQAIDLDGAEQLFQTTFEKLLKNGQLTVTFGDEMVVKYCFRGEEVHARITTDGVEATTLKAKAAEGKRGAFFYAPRLGWNYDEAKAVEQFTHEHAWEGAGGALFFKVGQQMDAQCQRPAAEKKQFEYENTFLHFSGQAITTMLFGESFTKYVADMHERKPSEGYVEIMSGLATTPNNSSFSKPYNGGNTLEYLTVDQIKDVFNNHLGRIVGSELSKKYGINSSTVWTDELSAKVLNDVMGSFTSENAKMKFTPFKPSDDFIKKFTIRLNTVMTNYNIGYDIFPSDKKPSDKKE